MSVMIRVLLTLLGLFASVELAAARSVPIEDFFRDPAYSSVSLSPTGEYMTVSVPQGDRTVLAAFRIRDMKLVGRWDYGAGRHIDRVRWVNDQRFFMFVSLKLGSFDFRVGTPDVYASNVDGRRRADIPNGGTYQIVDMLWDDPDHILVQRSIDGAFLSRMNVWNGAVRTVETAPLRRGSFLVDHSGAVRYAIGSDDQNRTITLRREGEDWVELMRAELGAGQMRLPFGFTPDNRQVYTSISRQGEPAGLYLVDPETETETLLVRNAHVDPSSSVLYSADGQEILAVRFDDGLPAYEFVNTDHPESRAYAGLINAFPNHAVLFNGISRDGRIILFTTYSDIDPGSVYLFDRQTGEARFLLAARDWIDPEQMSPMHPITVTARDGVVLHGYITIPRASEGRNLPMILHPHGGPHGVRDLWGFDPAVQFLASRGYAVLQINFRGSGGYGEAFQAKGFRNWGTSMIDDMTDAVLAMVERGIADRDRICSYGGSYGGYAALQAVVREPELYRCTIGYVGVFSLPLMFRDGDIPQTASGRNYLRRVLPSDPEEQRRQSPVYNVERIRIPVALVHGQRDQRVPMSQFRALKSALEAAGRPPELEIVERNEGHGFQDPKNNVRLYTQLIAFLDRHTAPRQPLAQQ